MSEKIRILVLGILLFMTGCSGEEYALDAKWLPLLAICERPAPVENAAPPGAITTVGQYCYVKSIDDWLAANPPASIQFQAVLRHEQEHSKRQLRTGTTLWVSQYLVDKTFALEEEKIGYYYELTEARRLGANPIPEAYAAMLSDYKILTGRLVSYADALNWVHAVLNGTWTPPN